MANENELAAAAAVVTGGGVPNGLLFDTVSLDVFFSTAPPKLNDGDGFSELIPPNIDFDGADVKGGGNCGVAVFTCFSPPNDGIGGVLATCCVRGVEKWVGCALKIELVTVGAGFTGVCCNCVNCG